MPRVKSDELNRLRAQQAILSGHMAMRGYKPTEGIMIICCLSESTARLRYKHPGNLKVDEIRRMNLTDEEIIQLVRGKK